jgi:DNA-binding Lrp family transcriptional regulator
MLSTYFLVKTCQGKLKITHGTLKEYEELSDVHIVLGTHDIIAKGVFEDKEDLQAFIQNKLQITEGIRDSQTLVVME